MTSRLLESYKQKIAVLELLPSDGGCFELTADGELIYSKLESGDFPDEEQVVREIGERLMA